MSARIEDRGDRLIVWNGNAEKRGALTPELYEAIAEAMRMAEDPRIRAVILTSEGRFFCAGGDLNATIVASRPMMTMTTINSTRVKPCSAERRADPNPSSPFVLSLSKDCSFLLKKGRASTRSARTDFSVTIFNS